MKLEVNISKGNLFVMITFLAVISAIFLAHATITDTGAPNHPGDQIRVSSGDYMDDSVDQAIDSLDSRLDNLESFSVGDNVVVTSDSISESTLRRTWDTLKIFTLGQSGKIRLDFQYRPSNDNYRIKTRVEKQDGTIVWEQESWYDNDNWEDQSIDIDVSSGDTFYIRGYSRDLYHNTAFQQDIYYGKVQVRNAKIKLANELPQITFD